VIPALALTLALAAPAEPVAAPAELPLADALAELDRQNPTLAQVRARGEQAEGLARQALAGLLPSLVASGSYVRNSAEARVNLGALLATLPIPTPPSLPPPLVIQAEEQLTGSVALRVPLLVPTGWFDAAAARDGARGAAEVARAARLQLRAALVQAAHLARAGEETVSASERAVENAARLADSAARKVKAGTAAPLDALRAETERVRRESDLVRARAELERARLAVGVLLGREAPVRVLVGEPTPPGQAEAAEALVAEALSQRPELRAQEAQRAAAEAGVRSAWARLAPQLSATLSATASDQPFPTGKTEAWRLSVDLGWALYDGGARYGKRREAVGRLAEAAAAESAGRLQVAQEARDAARDLEVAGARLRLAEEQRRLADEAAGTAHRSYEAGVLSSLDVIDANDRLFLADVGLAEARARVAAARAALDRALGRGP
jgi:outer membrane protein TolC